MPACLGQADLYRTLAGTSCTSGNIPRHLVRVLPIAAGPCFIDWFCAYPASVRCSSPVDHVRQRQQDKAIAADLTFGDAMIEPMAAISVIITPIRFVLLLWPWSRPAMTLPSFAFH